MNTVILESVEVLFNHTVWMQGNSHIITLSRELRSQLEWYKGTELESKLVMVDGKKAWLVMKK